MERIFVTILAELHQPDMYHKGTLTRSVVGQYILCGSYRDWVYLG